MHLKLTPSEQKAVDDIVRDLPPDEAARMRDRLVRDDVIVWGNDEEMHKKIEAFYATRSARLRAMKATRGVRLAARTADNSWVPGKEEQLFINNFLNRLPEGERAKARELLLRTDVRVLAKEGDDDTKKILDTVYELRGKKIKELKTRNNQR